MVTFRCKRSGNTVSFLLPSDIEGMRKHEGYEEVIEHEKAKTEESRVGDPSESKEVKVLKKRGPKPRSKIV